MIGAFEIGGKMVFPEPQPMEAMAPGHRTKSKKDWNYDRGIKLFAVWQGKSHDLNLMENLWSQINHIQRKERAISTKESRKLCAKSGGPSHQNSSILSMNPCQEAWLWRLRLEGTFHDKTTYL